MPQRHKVHNWSEYNASLQKRGDIFFFMKEETTEKLPGNMKYDDACMIMAHSIKYAFKLGYRQTQGFMESLKRQGLITKAPNYTTMCRRWKILKISIKDYRKNNDRTGIVCAIDSTGISVYHMSDWHRNMTAKERRHFGQDRYRKIHMMMNVNTGQTLDVEITPAYGKGTGDCSVGQELIDRSKDKIDTLMADGAYCTKAIHHTCYTKGIERILIPPARTHCVDKTDDAAFAHRNATLEDIQQDAEWDMGLKRWKKATGYHLRSRIEAHIESFKRSMGKHFHAVCDIRRTNEIKLKCMIHNAFRSFGSPRTTAL